MHAAPGSTHLCFILFYSFKNRLRREIQNLKEVRKIRAIALRDAQRDGNFSANAVENLAAELSESNNLLESKREEYRTFDDEGVVPVADVVSSNNTAISLLLFPI